MPPLKILITIDWFLPGTNSGGPVRSVANLIEALPECQIFVFTRNIDYCATEPYSDVLSDQWVQFSENCQVYYCSEPLLSKATLGNQLSAISPDVLYVNGIYSKAFSQWPVTLGLKSNIPTIVAARGMLSPHALAVKPLKKFIFLSFMRWINRYSKVVFHATSASEVQDIQQILGKRIQVRTIPNLAKEQRSMVKEILKETGKTKLVYIGRIAPEKGTMLALNALKEQKGYIELDLYGTCYNASYWKECQQVIEQLPENCTVRYHGACPSDEVTQHLQNAHALLLPSEGENYGHAIVEAFACARPVLISKHTPWKNLPAQQAGWDLETKYLASGISELTEMDQLSYNSWSKGAMNYYEKMISQPFKEHRSSYIDLFTIQ